MTYRNGRYELNGKTYHVFSTGRVDLVVPVRNSLNRSETTRVIRQDSKAVTTVKALATR